MNQQFLFRFRGKIDRIGKGGIKSTPAGRDRSQGKQDDLSNTRSFNSQYIKLPQIVPRSQTNRFKNSRFNEQQYAVSQAPALSQKKDYSTLDGSRPAARNYISQNNTILRRQNLAQQKDKKRDLHLQVKESQYKSQVKALHYRRLQQEPDEGESSLKEKLLKGFVGGGGKQSSQRQQFFRHLQFLNRVEQLHRR